MPSQIGGECCKVVPGPSRGIYAKYDETRARLPQGLPAQAAAGHPGEEDGGNAGGPSDESQRYAVRVKTWHMLMRQIAQGSSVYAYVEACFQL